MVGVQGCTRDITKAIDTAQPRDATDNRPSLDPGTDADPRPPKEARQVPMLGLLIALQLFSGQFIQYAIVFFVLAIIAALVGLRGVAGVSMAIARIFILVFLVLAIISLVL